MAYRRDGRLLVSGAADATVRFWNPVTCVSLGSLFQGAGVTDVAVSPDGRTLAVATPTRIRLWDISRV